MIQDAIAPRRTPLAACHVAGHGVDLAKKVVSHVTWAIDLELHDGARLLLQQRDSESANCDIDLSTVLLCAAASCCRIATLLMLRCGSPSQYVSMVSPLSPHDGPKLTFTLPPLPANEMYAAGEVTWTPSRGSIH